MAHWVSLRPRQSGGQLARADDSWATGAVAGPPAPAADWAVLLLQSPVAVGLAGADVAAAAAAAVGTEAAVVGIRELLPVFSFHELHLKK